MNTKKKIFQKIFAWCPVLLSISFIFHNSLTVASHSQQISYTVSKKILKYLHYLTLYSENIKIFDYYTRKFAHFSEFALLSILILFALSTNRIKKYNFLLYILFMICIPSIDETLQLFVQGRAGQWLDVFIDMSGYLFGSFLYYILYHIIKDGKQLIISLVKN